MRNPDYFKALEAEKVQAPSAEQVPVASSAPSASELDVAETKARGYLESATSELEKIGHKLGSAFRAFYNEIFSKV